jgi:hypothetical protein
MRADDFTPTAQDLDTLRRLSLRADEHGYIALEISDMPFFISRAGIQWLVQVSELTNVYRITDDGRVALERRS